MAEISRKEKKIIDQIEYYFGDKNLPRDKFLLDLVKQENGWVALEIMNKFHQVSKFTRDIKEMAEAMRKAKSGLIEVSQDGTKIRRSLQLPLSDNLFENRQQMELKNEYEKTRLSYLRY